MTHASASQPTPEMVRAASAWHLRLREEVPSEATLSEWLAWCNADPGHLQAFDQVEEMWAAMPRARHSRSSRVQASRWHGSWQRAAFAVPAFVVAAAILWMLAFQHPMPAAINTSNVLVSPQGENRETTLPDGSTVALSARSRLDVDFTEAARRVRLSDGQAIFTVAKDRTRPFVVNAEFVDITAVGTAFDVRNNGSRVVVTVLEGEVQVRSAGARKIEPVRLIGGQQSVFLPGEATVHVARVDTSAAVAWKQGRLEYVDEPLSAVVANVNRYSARRITLEDASIGDWSYTGSVRIDSLDEWLSALQRAFPFEVRAGEDGSAVISRR